MMVGDALTVNMANTSKNLPTRGPGDVTRSTRLSSPSTPSPAGCDRHDLPLTPRPRFDTFRSPHQSSSLLESRGCHAKPK